MQTNRIDQMTATLQGEAVSFSQRLDNQVRMLAQSTVELNSEATEFSPSSTGSRTASPICSVRRWSSFPACTTRSRPRSAALVVGVGRHRRLGQPGQQALDRLKHDGHRRVARTRPTSWPSRSPQRLGRGRGAARQRRPHQGRSRSLRPRFHRHLRPAGQDPDRPRRAVVAGMSGTLEELTTGLAGRIDDRSNDLLEIRRAHPHRAGGARKRVGRNRQAARQHLGALYRPDRDDRRQGRRLAGVDLRSGDQRPERGFRRSAKTLETTAGKVTGRITQTASSATQKLQSVAGGAAEDLDQLGKLMSGLAERLERSTADIGGEIRGTGDGITRTVQGERRIPRPPWKPPHELRREHRRGAAAVRRFMEAFARDYLQRGESAPAADTRQLRGGAGECGRAHRGRHPRARHAAFRHRRRLCAQGRPHRHQSVELVQHQDGRAGGRLRRGHRQGVRPDRRARRRPHQHFPGPHRGAGGGFRPRHRGVHRQCRRQRQGADHQPRIDCPGAGQELRCGGHRARRAGRRPGQGDEPGLRRAHKRAGRDHGQGHA